MNDIHTRFLKCSLANTLSNLNELLAHHGFASPSRVDIFLFALCDVVDVCGYPPNQADHACSHQSNNQSCH